MLTRTALLIPVLCVFLPGSALSEGCWNPPDPIENLEGDHVENGLEFGYVSSLYRESGDFRFYRCVEDRASAPFAVDWKHLKLNTTVDADDNAYVDFAARNDDKAIERSSLYFGAAPDKVRPDAVFKPDEAEDNQAGIAPQNGLPIVRAQLDTAPSLSEALTSRDAFETQVARLRGIDGENAVFRSFSYARVFLPVNEADHARLRTEDGAEELSGQGFFAVEIAVGETYGLGEESLRVEPMLRIRVRPEDVERFFSSELRPKISFEGPGTEFLGKTLGVPEQVTLEKNVLSWGDEQVTRSFPIERVEQELTVRIDGFATVTLPILVTPPG